MKYHINYRPVKLDSNKIEFDVWVTTQTCAGEYIGQYKSLKQAHKAIQMMIDSDILF